MCRPVYLARSCRAKKLASPPPNSISRNQGKDAHLLLDVDSIIGVSVITWSRMPLKYSSPKLAGWSTQLSIGAKATFWRSRSPKVTDNMSMARITDARNMKIWSQWIDAHRKMLLPGFLTLALNASVRMDLLSQSSSRRKLPTNVDCYWMPIVGCPWFRRVVQVYLWHIRRLTQSHQPLKMKCDSLLALNGCSKHSISQ